MRKMLAVALAALVLPAGAQEKKKMPKIALPPDSVYLIPAKALDGKPADLKEQAGKVALIVNLASQ